MPLVKNPKHIFEPTSLQCGQAVISMLSGVDVKQICLLVGTERETTLKDMKKAFNELGISLIPERKEAQKREDLPDIALLSLETPKCWHWSCYYNGVFFDPEYGPINDFPPSNRKYFWEIIP